MEKVNGLGIASLVLGIVGILLSCLGIGFIFGLIGVVLGILGLTVLKNSKKGIAIAGTVVSGVTVVIGVGLMIVGFSIGAFGDNNNSSSSLDLFGNNNNNNKMTASYDSSTPASGEEEVDEGDGTYENNGAFDIVEKSSYVNSIGSTYIIHKVKAKKDVSVTATMIAKDSSGAVIGKSTDDIVLTKGEYNYFQYVFQNDVSKASFEVSSNTKNDSIMTGERSAVEMESYNKANDYLYITVKQVGENVSSFSKYKILLYKGGKLVKSDFGYFTVHTEGLNGKGTTDVIEIWEYGIDYDSVEFFYEP